MTTAIVARTGIAGLQFLAQAANGAHWVIDARLASRFTDFRAATRAALLLPANLRAFALPMVDTGARLAA